MAVDKSPRERTRILMSNPPIKVVERMINGKWTEVSRTKMPKATSNKTPIPNFTPGSGQDNMKPTTGSVRRSAMKSGSKPNGQSSSGYGSQQNGSAAAKSKGTSSTPGRYVKRGR